jgi:glyoxylase I family protein
MKAIQYTEQHAISVLGEPYTKHKPHVIPHQDTNPELTSPPPNTGTDADTKNTTTTNNNNTASRAPPLKLTSIDHYAIHGKDVDALSSFYQRILGFVPLPRPDLGFPGYWLLSPSNIRLDIIQTDPTVPYTYTDWKEQYDVGGDSNKVEPWFIRRGAHHAFEVEDFQEAEERLRAHGVEYCRFVLPEVEMKQLFLWDPEGNGIELGRYDDTRKWVEEKEKEGGGGEEEAGKGGSGEGERRRRRRRRRGRRNRGRKIKEEGEGEGERGVDL